MAIRTLLQTLLLFLAVTLMTSPAQASEKTEDLGYNKHIFIGIGIGEPRRAVFRDHYSNEYSATLGYNYAIGKRTAIVPELIASLTEGSELHGKYWDVSLFSFFRYSFARSGGLKCSIGAGPGLSIQWVRDETIRNEHDEPVVLRKSAADIGALLSVEYTFGSRGIGLQLIYDRTITGDRDALPFGDTGGLHALFTFVISGS